MLIGICSSDSQLALRGRGGADLPATPPRRCSSSAPALHDATPGMRRWACGRACPYRQSACSSASASLGLRYGNFVGGVPLIHRRRLVVSIVMPQLRLPTASVYSLIAVHRAFAGQVDSGPRPRCPEQAWCSGLAILQTLLGVYPQPVLDISPCMHGVPNNGWAPDPLSTHCRTMVTEMTFDPTLHRRSCTADLAPVVVMLADSLETQSWFTPPSSGDRPPAWPAVAAPVLGVAIG